MIIEINFIWVQNTQRLNILGINKEKLNKQEIYNVYGSKKPLFV